VPVCSNCGTDNPAVARFCMSCASPLAAEPEAAPRELRKTVTVLFTDIAGSTPLGERLDPEALRRVMSMYFARMKAVVERHGGTVEKFIGDAVMAVFGIPVLHEDDALRAIRAATDMREALHELNQELERDRGVRIEVRTGINTGEVVAGDPSRGQALVTGDAVNTAARLEQAAASGEILIGDATHRLVRDGVNAEPVSPLALKGKADPVPAFRLLDVSADATAVARRLDSPMVGREREWALLSLAFDRAVGDRTCHLITVLGAAGVGKSRLVEEFVHSVASRVDVLRGRCLSYGEGITFWPVIEAVRAAASIDDDDEPAEARQKLRALVESAESADLIAERVAQVMGLVADSAVAEETFWAIRRLFETLAERRPLVLVFDDIHWAEPTFLDLVEHVADWSRDAPMTVMCTSRQELLDHRPGWGGGKVNATTVLLEPLTVGECDELIENLLGRTRLADQARDRILEAAEGNPLFVEQMLSMLIDDGLLHRDDGHWVPTGELSQVQVPPSIQALLAARLDRLADEERAVIERAAVVGRVFYRGAVSELSPEPLRPAVPTHLMTLVRRELIRPQASEYGQETYRFRHMLIRDAAYEAMPKQVRADLHERFAAWLEAQVGDRVREYEEILGYHLEEAHRYLSELGPLDERGRELGRRAGSLLGSAGVRALARGDVSATVTLLRRATSLLPEDDPYRLDLLPGLGEALLQSARIEETGELVEEGLRLAESQGNASAILRLRLVEAWHAISVGGEHDMHWGVQTVQQVLQEAEATGDPSVEIRAREAAGWFLFWSGRSREAEAVLEEGLARARASAALEGRLVRALSALSIWGHVPVERALQRWTEVAQEASGETEAVVLGVLGVLSAMRGDFETARSNLHRGEAKLRDLGHALDLAAGHPPALVALMAGDFAGAEERTRKGIEALEAAGETGFLSTSAVFLAEALYGQGRYKEAVEASRLSEANTSPGDVASEMGWRVARAKALARLGELEEAERLAREAVSIGERTDHVQRADCYEAVAVVLGAGGRLQEAVDAARVAVDVFELKGDVVSATRVKRLIEELRG
jgi:class 3 adenylate cyclase/tetratricopeptide (TPR) repeat protein